MTPLQAAQAHGQSLWLNYLRRAFIESGELRDVLDLGISAITSTPAIFAKAISASADYDQALLAAVAAGKPVQAIYETLILDDIQRAADILLGVFEDSDGLNGYVTVELDPQLTHDATNTVAAALHLIKAADRANVMVEVPATEAGIEAIEALTADGVHTNATHIFSLAVYRQVAEAYTRGLQRYADTHSVWPQVPPASVASISLSHVDRQVDELLRQLGQVDLCGRTGIALAKAIYQHFCQSQSQPLWQRLARQTVRGRPLRPQRPKWTRTRPPSFRYPETLYVEALIGPDTVCTLAPATLAAFRRQGTAAATLTQDMDEAQTHLSQLETLGIDLEVVGQDLQRRSLTAFKRQFQTLIDSVRHKRNELESDWSRLTTHLGRHEAATDKRLAAMGQARLMCRIWESDPTVWEASSAEAGRRLGWLHLTTAMQEQVEHLQHFGQSVNEQGFTDAVVLSVNGAGKVADLFGRTFGWYIGLIAPTVPRLNVTVLDTVDPASIAAQLAALDLDKTLFVVAGESGAALETLALFNFFYQRTVAALGPAAAGAHFVAITEPGSELLDLAHNHGFRDIFVNDPTSAGCYAALSFSGLVPAVLAGVDLPLLLDRALAMAVNAHGCNTPLKGDNVAAHLGAILGELVLAGRDKLTLLASPAVAAFGGWLERLIAESTGDSGVGIVPIIAEPPGAPEDYGADRFFVFLRLDQDTTLDGVAAALRQAGRPLITCHLKDIYDLGGLIFTWEMAMAVAAYHLGTQPFDRPEMAAAKTHLQRLLHHYQQEKSLPENGFAPLAPASLDHFLADLSPGDYLAVQVYAPPSPELDAALQRWRLALRARTGLATTVNYGPLYLPPANGSGRGHVIQLLAVTEPELVIPSQPAPGLTDLHFGTLREAQALGQAQILRAGDHRIVRFRLGPDPAADLQELLKENG